MTTSLPARPVPVVLAAPSGTGKTTIAHALVNRYQSFVFSVSVTTRSARVGERQGRDYEFISKEAFRELVDQGELVEWAEVHGSFYGTPRRNLESARDRGQHPLLDIDVQGARQIREQLPDAVLIFVFPPDAAALHMRLTARGTEESGEVRRRLSAAGSELGAAGEFDYIIVNDDLESAIRQVREIVRAEGHRPSRTTNLHEEVSRIREEIEEILKEKL